MTDDRAEMQAARAHGKAKHHEQRLDRAAYTASEVRVLTDAALLLGRREAAEEILAAMKRRSEIAQRVPVSERSGVREGMVVTWVAAEKLVVDTAKGDPT